MTARKHVALDKKRLWRDIDRDEKRKVRARLRELRDQIRAARARRAQALIEAKERCRTERLAARERALAMRERILRELRESMQAERTDAKNACAERLTQARAVQDDVARARAEFLAETQYRADLRRIERANRDRLREAPSATRAERMAESDGVVRANLPPDLLPAFERVKRSIKASPRMSRTEAFLKWAEDHPSEIVEALEDKTEMLIRELQQKERAAAKALRARSRRPTTHAEVPF